MSDREDEVKTKTTKRKPGRPRSRPVKLPSVRKGIQDKPETETNVIELQYCSAMVLKKLGALSKSLNSDYLCLVFEKTEVYMLMYSWSEHCKVKVHIDGVKLHSYYCESPQTIYISTKNWETVIQKIDKDCDEFIICIDKNNVNKEININLINSYGIYNYLEVDIIKIPPDDMKVKLEDFDVLDEDNYDIIFTLPSTSLKKIFGTEKNIDNNWKIQKDGRDGDIEFGYDSKNKQVRGRQVPAKDKKVIKYIKNLDDDRTFLINFRLDDIKPATDTQLTNTMIVKASDKNQPLWLIALLDVDELKVLENKERREEAEKKGIDYVDAPEEFCITVDILVNVQDYKGNEVGLNAEKK
jgi:hypothetical protein